MDIIKERISKRWWVSLIVGILAVILGIYFLTNLYDAFETLCLFVAVYFFVTGITSFAAALASKGSPNWGISLFLSIIALISGCLLMFSPGLSEVFLIVITGVGLISEAINMIFGAIALRQVTGSAWIITLILGIIFLISALMVAGSPILSFLLITIPMSVSVLVFGVQAIFLSFHLKNL